MPLRCWPAIAPRCSRSCSRDMRAAGYSTGRGSRLHSRGNLVAAMPTLICSSP
jgi:hypothetical protein